MSENEIKNELTVVEEVVEPDLFETPEDFEHSVEESIHQKVAQNTGEYSRSGCGNTNKYTHKAATKRHRRNRNIVMVSIVTFVVLVFGAGAAYAYNLLNMTFDDNDNETREVLKTTDFNEPFYMVLVGTDTREKNGSYQLTDGRSDSCILVYVDPNTKYVSLVSIPRDTMITYDGSTEKFNAAYNYGGVKDTIKAINAMCGIEVSHYAEISFNGLTDMVDAVGGVEVNVPDAITDPKVDAYVPAGTSTLNGIQALSFARTRQYGDGDFSRSANQRILIQALVQKAYKLPLSDLPNVLQAAKKFIKTDFSVMQMYSLAQKFKDAEKLNMYAAMVPSTTGTIGGASYCFTDKEALSRMIKMIENGEDPLMTEITSGAVINSSRDNAELDAKRKQYYIDHPNSPGKATEKSATSVDAFYGKPACVVSSKSDYVDQDSTSKSGSNNSKTNSSSSSSSSSY